MPVTVHATTPDAVLIGAAASDDDMLAAIRGAAAGPRVLRIHEAGSVADLEHISALAEGYGWSPTFRLHHPCRETVDMLLGGGL